MGRGLGWQVRASVAAGLMWAALPLCGQKATAVPKLDLNQLSGTWYQIARLPDKAEKKCLSDGMMLWALSDKKDSFQLGKFCKIKAGNLNSDNNFGKQEKDGSGRLKVRRLVIFSTKYWVLATGPNFEWALVGNPNHKALWVLARTPTLDEATVTQVESQATAQGFPVAKLRPVTHTQHSFKAEEMGSGQ